MDSTDPNPALVYEEHFVPALFGPFAERFADWAEVDGSKDVLDVACGTGALTRAVRSKTRGRVVGADVAEAMLAVARTRMDGVEWTSGSAEQLPFEDESFDVVVSQFGLMFFSDRTSGLQEMLRVLRPGGTLHVAVCGGVDLSSGYAVLTELLHRLFGPEIAEAFRAPFVLGDRKILLELGLKADLPEPRISRLDVDVRFPSIEALVSTERACAWTLGGLLDADQFGRLLAEAEESLTPFVTSEGHVRFRMPCLILSADRPA